MYQIRENTKNLLAQLVEEEKRANNELKMLPKGKLHQVLRNNKITYFQVTRENDIRKRKSINKEPETIQNLARKMYLEKEIQMIQANIRLISSIEGKLEDISADSITEKLPIKVKHLLKPQNIDWGNQDYQRSTYRAEDLRHTTSRGLKVRSKSEVIIAETLYAYDIKFRYEEVMWVNEHQFIPDFTIMTPSNRMFYWEHCGMTNNPEYMRHHKWKMEQYEKIGIVPWKNLIVTYDTEEGIIDTNVIRSEILNKLK